MFKNADIDGLVSYEEGFTPTEWGYCYSTEKLDSGESIVVWTNECYRSYEGFFGYESRGTEAEVVMCVKTYRVKVSRGFNTCTITYYRGNSDTVSSIFELEKAEEHKIQVADEFVKVYYETD